MPTPAITPCQADMFAMDLPTPEPPVPSKGSAPSPPPSTPPSLSPSWGPANSSRPPARAHFAHPFEHIVQQWASAPAVLPVLPPDYDATLSFPFHPRAFDPAIAPGAARLAQAMLDLAIADLSATPAAPDHQPGLFEDDPAIETQHAQLSAVIWLFACLPDGNFFSFDWVCDVLGLDAPRFRRLAARQYARQISDAMRIIALVLGPQQASECARRLADFTHTD